MSNFLLLLHENPQSFKGLSASEMQAVIARYTAWAEQLGAQGRLKGGEKLKDEGGRVLRGGPRGVVASDGPYAELKDVVSGFFIVSAASYSEAESLIAGCPHLEHGWIELRELETVQ